MQFWICCFWLSVARLFQFTGRICSINPSFLSQSHSFKCCLGCWHPAECFQALPTSPGVCAAEALCLHLIICPWLLSWVSSGPCSQTISLLEVMWVSRGSGTAQPGSWRWIKESSCRTSGGQRGVKLGLLHVVISSEKGGLWAWAKLWYHELFNGCFKSFYIFTFNTLKVFLRKRERKATKHSEDLGRN